jgi:hypothetical protein
VTSSSTVLFSLSAAAVVSFHASTSNAAIIVTKKVSTPHAGVTLIEGTTRAPSSAFHAVKVALCTAGVRVEATAPPTAFRTVPAWAADVGASVAVNGDFFRPELRVQGMAVGAGKVWPIARTGIDPAVSDEFYYDRFGWIAFGPDFVEFTHTEHVKKNAAKFNATQGYSPKQVVHTLPKGIVALVSGFPELVTEGKQYTCPVPTASTCFPDRTDMRARHPRTAMGLSQDRRTFILAVVDGRSATSAGMYGTELAELMTELGAWQAFNLDGGGSSTMWIEGKGTINDPSDGSPRAVLNHWGILNGSGAAAHCMKAPPQDAGADAATPLDDGGVPDASGPPGPGAPPSGDPGDAPAAAEPDADAGDGCTQSARSSSPIGAAAVVALALLLSARKRRGC